MRRTLHKPARSIRLAVVLSLCAAGASPGADWPQWGGDGARNMASAERGLPACFELIADDRDRPADSPAPDGRVKWSAALGTQTYSTPAVAGGRVFVGTNDAHLADVRLASSGGGLMMCLDEATGRVLWQLPTPRRVFDTSELGLDRLRLGICGPPTVEGDRLYVVTNRAEVLCLDVHGQADGNDGPFLDEAGYMSADAGRRIQLRPTDGDIVWICDMLTQAPTWPHDAANSAVLVCGDLLYVGTSNGLDRRHRYAPRPEAPSVIAIDKRTGRIVAGDDRRIASRAFDGQWSSPAMDLVNGRPLIAFGGGDGLCYAFHPPDAPMDAGRATLPLAGSFDCNPPEYRLRDGERIRYRAKAGPSEIVGTPVFHDGRLYVTIGQDPRHGVGNGALTCIDAREGRLDALWVNKDIGRSLSTVSVADGLVFVADIAGFLHCLDAATGRTLWTQDLQSAVWGSTLVADGKVYVATEGRRLWVLRAGRERQVLGRIRLPAPMYASPVAANGVLYLAAQSRLFAVERAADGRPEGPGR